MQRKVSMKEQQARAASVTQGDTDGRPVVASIGVKGVV